MPGRNSHPLLPPPQQIGSAPQVRMAVKNGGMLQVEDFIDHIDSID